MNYQQFLNLNTEVEGGLRVSTVSFQGLDGLCYETAVFGEGYECLYCKRTASKWYAIQTHNSTVEGLENGSIVLDYQDPDQEDYDAEYWYEYRLWKRVC